MPFTKNTDTGIRSFRKTFKNGSCKAVPLSGAIIITFIIVRVNLGFQHEYKPAVGFYQMKTNSLLQHAIQIDQHGIGGFGMTHIKPHQVRLIAQPG